MKLKRAIAAIVLVPAFATPVAAGTFEDAVDAHARGDYANALRLIRPLRLGKYSIASQRSRKSISQNSPRRVENSIASA
jgi:hypothetical protein